MAEFRTLLAEFADQQDDKGRARVVRSGNRYSREVLMGVGSVTAKVAKVRSLSGGLVNFQSASVVRRRMVRMSI